MGLGQSWIGTALWRRTTRDERAEREALSLLHVQWQLRAGQLRKTNSRRDGGAPENKVADYA